jgi:predicted ATPase
VSQPLDRFHVLVGPNASGKTTFLDVIAFLNDLVNEGLEAALKHRTPNFDDLLYGKRGDRFELAIETTIPPQFVELVSNGGEYDAIRYEVAIGRNEGDTEVVILSETLRFVGNREKHDFKQKDLFPGISSPPETIIYPDRKPGTRTILKKVPGGNDNFYSEVYPSKAKGWAPAFKLGPRRSALANLPEDETKFPVSTWLKNFLTQGVQAIVLDSLIMRESSPPGQTKKFKPDGSNLPWVIAELIERYPENFRDWLLHVKTALPDLIGIRTGDFPDTKKKYIVLEYETGIEVPSWTTSDGTLRLLALTLPAYLPDLEGVFLIEEPENGIHPRAIETMYQSLSNVYDSQILMATHSPVILSNVEPEQVLCFAKQDGATDIVRGDLHPNLRDWQRETSLSTLFAAGVLG